MEEEEIVKARFFIAPKDEHSTAQHIGCRLVLTEKLIHAGFKKGRVFNLDDGTVEVALEGKRSEVETFHLRVQRHLVEWLLEKATDKEKLKKLIGNPGIFVTDLEIMPQLHILDLGLYSHSLELNQLGKGVDIYYVLVDELRKGKDSYNLLAEEVGRGKDAYTQLKEAIADLKEVNKSLLEEIARGRP